MDEFDRERLERYGRELDDIREQLQAVHPIGNVKAIGRMEAAQALREVLAKGVRRAKRTD